MTTFEQWTIGIALFSLLVTICGWVYTALSQRKLLEMQNKAERERDSWQLIHPPRIQELREMKGWVENGSRLFALVGMGNAEQKQLDDWVSEGSKFLILAKRLDWRPQPEDISLYLSVVSYYTRLMVYFEYREQDTGSQDSADRANEYYLPKALTRIDEAIEKIAYKQIG